MTAEYSNQAVSLIWFPGRRSAAASCEGEKPFMTKDLTAIVEFLDLAARLGVAVTPFARRHGLSEIEAYAVQMALVGRRLARGERRIGQKMGFTSAAMRQQMGVHEANCGWLTDAMALGQGQVLALGPLIHPRAEPEVAVRLGRDLTGEEPPAALAAAVEAYAPAIEVVDSRLFEYRFDWLDNVADNSSSAAFVTGDWVAAPFETGTLTVRLYLDDALVEQGSSRAVEGHPLAALAVGARLGGRLGWPLKAGDVILTGGITKAPRVMPGVTVRAEFDGLGTATLLTGE